MLATGRDFVEAVHFLTDLLPAQPSALTCLPSRLICRLLSTLFPADTDVRASALTSHTIRDFPSQIIRALATSESAAEPLPGPSWRSLTMYTREGW